MKPNWLWKRLLLSGLFIILLPVPSVAVIHKTNTISRMPKFIKEPPGVIYYSPADWTGGGGQHVINFEIETIVHPFNASLVVAAAYKENPEHHLQLPVFRLSGERVQTGLHEPPSQPYASFEPTTPTSSFSAHKPSTLLRMGLVPDSRSTEHRAWLIRVYNLFPNMLVYLLLSTELGSVRTRPMRLVPIDLPRFPRYADERLFLLIGNTGRVICHLPRSQPSLPVVHFYHKGKQIDMLTEASRYRLVYVGGDGSGTPWSSTRSKNIEKDPVFWQPMPSAVILFIHPLELSDSGEYKCEAQLKEQAVMAEQKTFLNVTKPRAKVKARLQFSSDDPGLSYLYDNYMSSQVVSGTRIWNVPVGLNLSLFCLYEGAPIVPTRWYFDGTTKNFREDTKFGILTIDSVTLDDAGTYTCLTQSPGIDAISKSFKIKVTAPSHLTAQPDNVVKVNKGDNLVLGCSITDSNTAQGARMQNNWSDLILKENRKRDDKTLRRRFQPGTDIGWLFNGRSIKRYGDVGMPLIEATDHATIYRVQNFSEHDQGIYQCWTLDSKGVWTTAVISVRLQEEEHSSWTEQDSQFRQNVIQERTKEGLTGHLNCNLSSMHLGSADDQEELLVFWFRGRQLGEPIDLVESNNKAGRIKYLTSRVNRKSQLLSIVNPRRSEDSGAYSCRVYNPATRALLGQTQFELIIDPSEEEGIDTRRMGTATSSSRSSNQITTRIATQGKNMRNVSLKLPVEDLEYTRQMDNNNFMPQFALSQPTVVRISNFSTSIWISWTVNDQALKHKTTEFSMQYRIQMPLLPTYGIRHPKNRRTPRTAALLQQSADLWSNPKTTNVSTNQSFLCIQTPAYFQPGNIYSIRIIANIEPLLQPAIQPRNYQSPWSDAINFEDLSATKPRVISLTAQNSTSLELEWTMDPQFDVVHLDRGSAHAVNQEHPLHFFILYKPLRDSHSGYLWISCTPNGSHANPQLTVQQWSTEANTVGEQKNYKFAIRDLRKSTTYAVAVYGRISQPNQLLNQTTIKYTLLSETVIQTTPSEVGSSRVDQKLTTTPSGKDPSVPQGAADGNNPVVTIGPEDRTQKTIAKHKMLYSRENHILIVVLGSLAGVLLVVAITLITLCLWCQLRTKRRSSSDAFPSPNKGPLTSSTDEVPRTPLAQEMNGHPCLPYPDAYLTDYLLATSTTLNSNLHLYGNFAPMFQEPSPNPRWSTLAFGGTHLHQNSMRPWSSSMDQTTMYPVGNGKLVDGGGQSSQPSSGALNEVFFATDQSSYKLSKNHERNFSPVVSAHDDCDTSRKFERFGSIPFYPENADEEPNGGQNDQSSSVYSHIGSLSTLNELPPRIYDKNGPKPANVPTVSSPIYIPGQDRQVMRPIPMYLTSLHSFPTSVLDHSMDCAGFGSSSMQPDLTSVAQQSNLFYRTLPTRNLLDHGTRMDMFQRFQSPDSTHLPTAPKFTQAAGLYQPSITGTPVLYNNVFASTQFSLSPPNDMLCAGKTFNAGAPGKDTLYKLNGEVPWNDANEISRNYSENTNGVDHPASTKGSTYADSGVDLQHSGNGGSDKHDLTSNETHIKLISSSTPLNPDSPNPQQKPCVIGNNVKIRKPFRKQSNRTVVSCTSSQSDGSFDGESRPRSSKEAPLLGEVCTRETNNLRMKPNRPNRRTKRPYLDQDCDETFKNSRSDCMVLR